MTEMMARTDADTIAVLREQIADLRETRGSHTAQLKSLNDQAQEIREDVKTILSYIERTKGSWKTILVIGGMATAFVEGAHELLTWIHH